MDKDVSPDGAGLSPFGSNQPAAVSPVPASIPDAGLRIAITITPDMDANAAGELILTFINDRERWGYMTHEFMRGDFREVTALPSLEVRTICCGYWANSPGEDYKVNWWHSDALGLDIYLHWDGDGTIVIQHADWTLENGDCKKSYGWGWVGDGHWSRDLPPNYYAHPAIAIEAGTAETEGLSPKGESAGREASPVSSSIRSAMEGE